MLVNVGITTRDLNGALMYVGLPLANDPEDREVLEELANKIDTMPTTMQVRFGILSNLEDGYSPDLEDGYSPDLEWTKNFGFYDVIVEKISISRKTTEPFILKKAKYDAVYVPELRLRCRLAGRIHARIPAAITVSCANFLSTLGLTVEVVGAVDQDGFCESTLYPKRDRVLNIIINGGTIGCVEVN